MVPDLCFEKNIVYSLKIYVHVNYLTTKNNLNQHKAFYNLHINVRM